MAPELVCTCCLGHSSHRRDSESNNESSDSDDDSPVSPLCICPHAQVEYVETMEHLDCVLGTRYTRNWTPIAGRTRLQFKNKNLKLGYMLCISNLAIHISTALAEIIIKKKKSISINTQSSFCHVPYLC